MEHPAFENAGANPGIEIWTIEQFEPVPVDPKMYGKFYNGDSYIVLKTTGRANSSLNYDVHFWLGVKTSQDEMGSAAIWTVALDDQLGGRAVHHREVQGHESSTFLAYFKPAIRYLEGGNDSGFTAVEINAGAEKRLLRLSGCDTMRIEEVPAEFSSLTKDNCFILEVEHDIFVLMPEGAKATQRRKIIQVANKLRDDDHNGRASIEIIDEFSSEEDIALFFEALGSGSINDLSASVDQDSYTRDDMTAVYLYRVLGDFELISMSKPYKQSQLNSSEIYILDTPDSGIFMWVGHEVDAESKKNYNKLVNQYLGSKGYPLWLKMTKITEGAESADFKQYFDSFKSSGPAVAFRTTITESDGGYFSEDAEELRILGKSATARGFMPGDGEGNIVVTCIFRDQSEDITETMLEKPQLYDNRMYVVKYHYIDDDGNDAYVVYLWAGRSAEIEDRKTALEFVSQLDEELGNQMILVKIPQGKEPRHFLSLFKGRLSIMFNDHGDGTNLFRVEGAIPDVDMVVNQVSPCVELFQEDDVLILDVSSGVYVWVGQKSTEQEKIKALEFCETLGNEPLVVEQGNEDPDFWNGLSGHSEDIVQEEAKWHKAASRRLVTPTTLTAVNVTVTNKMKFEELPAEFEQQDLSEDGLYIVDTGEELYLWQGKDIPERYKRMRPFVIEGYINDDGLDRTVESALVVCVKQGAEPAVFTNLFPAWDKDMWENQTSYEDMKNEAKAANSK